MSRCKIPDCNGLGKLRSNGRRFFPIGYCNSHYQLRARQNDNRIAVYYKMVNRCNNPKNEGYKDYGGRGIVVCYRWLPKNNGFQNFCTDMGERPDNTTLDRIDVNAGYFKENCRWAEAHVQANNRRDIIIKKEDTYIPKDLRHRGVTFRKYKYKNGKQYINKHCMWCASLWIGNQHFRIYCNDRETAIMARLGMEIALLGDTLD